MYRIDIMTLFPDSVGDVLSESILGRAQERDHLRIETHQIRDYTVNRQKQVDDYPYGGGRGAILQADPLYRCWEHIRTLSGGCPHTIFLSPCGKTFTQADARRLASDYDRLILLCGHYEGVDQRFIDACVDEEVSLGDFVLTGGEIAAMAVADAVSRLVPGVLPDPECFENESHWAGLLEYPQYSRPEVWHGMAVPRELLSGNHREVARWQRKMQLQRTRERRPDLFAAFRPENPEDENLLAELARDEARPKLTQQLTCRRAEPGDLPFLMSTVNAARTRLASAGIDQWQEPGYPSEAQFLADIRQGSCFVLLHGADAAACFVLTPGPEADYASITDGRWSGDEPYTVLHRCAVAEGYLGSGAADEILRQCEVLTLAMGRRWLRADTHKKNRAMLKLLRRSGFQYRGNILLSAMPEGHDPRRVAYEKRLRLPEVRP